jgi:uncharacterized protein (DUF849 family)
LWFGRQLAEEKLSQTAASVQHCRGVTDELATIGAMVAKAPAGCTFSASAPGRHQMPYVAASDLSGGGARVGMEDNRWLARGKLASHAETVERAVTIVKSLGAQVASAQPMREKLGLVKRLPMGGA